MIQTFFLFNTVYSILFSKSPPSQENLDFLVGFCEGDGGCCKQQKKNKKTFDFSYRITQRSVKILLIIQNILDFGGNLSPKQKNPARSFRLTFTRRDQMLCFIVLFDGQFRFVERDTTYRIWATLFFEQHLALMTGKLSAKLGISPPPATLFAAQDLWIRAKPLCTLEEARWYPAFLLTLESFQQRNIPVASFGSQPFHDFSGIACQTKLGVLETQTAWLSGFMEAEGTFRSQFYVRPNVKRGYSVALGIEFRQNRAYHEFSVLQNRFGGHLRTENKSVQLRIAAKGSLKELKEYFTKYPLRGRKHIAQSRWIRAYRLREQNHPLPPANTLEYRRFVRLFQSVNYVRE